MKGTSLVGALACALWFGCQSPASGPAPAPTDKPLASTSGEAPAPSARAPSAKSEAAGAVREGNAVVRVGDVVFVADEDHGVVRAIALPAEVKSERVDFATAGRPVAMVSAGDRLFVTIRQIGTGDGALLALKRKGRLGLEEVGRVALPVDAWGLAISPDAKTALVTSAWTHKLASIDLDALKVRWTTDVAREPRGVTILPKGDRAYVSHLIGGAVTRVDGLAADKPDVKRVELPASPMRSPYNVKLGASNGWSVMASPTGDRVFFPRHALGALGPDDWFGEGVVDVMLSESETNAAPTRNARATARFTQMVEQAFPSQRWMAGNSPIVESSSSVTGVHAIVYRKKTSSLLLVSTSLSDVVELDALVSDPTLARLHAYSTGSGPSDKGEPGKGAAPVGLALSENEDQAYVFCRGSDDLILVNLAPEEGSYKIAPASRVQFPNEDPKELVAGRQLFLNGYDRTLSGGLACDSCHPEGRDDGFTWHEVTFTGVKDQPANTPQQSKFTNFFAGTDLSAINARWGEQLFEGEHGFGYARQTPMLAGRVKAKGPYGWHGESETIEDRISASFGLHRWQTGYDDKAVIKLFAHLLAGFVREGLVPPPREERPLTDEESRGKAIFESPAAQCSTCHVPASEYTDRVPVPLKAIRPPSGYAEDPNPAFKTPSLKYVGSTAPYMHDGRFESLESVIEYNQDRMGKTSQLSADDKKALVAFLRTL